MIVVVIIIALLVIYLIFRKKSKKVGAIHTNKNVYFNNLHFSTEQFYSLVEKILDQRQMPGVKISRVSYHEGSILSNKREYLRVERKDDLFDICAAPFGTGFFVSYWHGEPKHALRDIALKVPYLSTAVEGWQGTTYFKMDTASMFKACVKDSIMEAIDEITNTKGVRRLSENERMAFAQ